MKRLPEVIKRTDFIMELVKRTGDVAIYKQIRDNKPQFVHYEVVIIKKTKESTIFDRNYPERETYPPTSLWGSYGWTFNTIEHAEKKFKELCLKKYNI